MMTCEEVLDETARSPCVPENKRAPSFLVLSAGRTAEGQAPHNLEASTVIQQEIVVV